VDKVCRVLETWPLPVAETIGKPRENHGKNTDHMTKTMGKPWQNIETY
jgi:hypothetical protein